MKKIHEMRIPPRVCQKCDATMSEIRDVYFRREKQLARMFPLQMLDRM
jgi:hypothetical protein